MLTVNSCVGWFGRSLTTVKLYDKGLHTLDALSCWCNISREITTSNESLHYCKGQV